MHIWTIEKWRRYIDGDSLKGWGIYIRCEKCIDDEVKRSCKEFISWIRKVYVFPIRVRIYLKAAERIKALDGDWAVGTFFEPYKYDGSIEPYIRIATGDYADMEAKWGKDDALARILATIAHELTHYFQWINNLKLTPMGRERQANQYAGFILAEYAHTRTHP